MSANNQNIILVNNSDFYFKNLHNKFLNFEKIPNTISLSISHSDLEGVKYARNNSFIRWLKYYYKPISDLLNLKYVIHGYWAYDHKLKTHTFLESDIFDKEENLYLSFLSRRTLLSPYKFIRSVASVAALRISRYDQLTTLLNHYNNQLSIKHENNNHVITNYQLNFR